MIKKILFRAVCGFVLGIAVCSVISTLFNDAQVSAAFVAKIGSQKAALLLQLLLSGLYGAVCMGSTVLHNIDRMPMALACLLHCLCCVLPFIPLALLLDWGGGGIGGVLIMTAFQTAGYFIIWLVMFARYKKQIKELNAINEIQKQKTEEKEV